MMNNIVAENLISFKELEQKILIMYVNLVGKLHKLC